MPAMLDDPTAPAIYRVSGTSPYPLPFGPLPPEIAIRQVTLRDRVTVATLLPFSSPTQVPPRLTAFLCDLLNREIDKGDTYPMMEPMPLSSFGPYWIANFGAIMVMGEVDSVEEVTAMEERGVDWARECLGSFYVKPNYPGRSSHVCNGGFLVSDAARNRGVGRLMGECYLDWAPKLGYTYSVFNLVYETNVASLRIWDALGFKRIGRVKGCGNLKSFPDTFVDAIIFGRELGGEGDEYVTEERFDKIRFYLKTGTYPNGSDRAEKSRLRSAATHYRLVPNTNTDDSEEDKLMLKGKEVISDPHKQYEIARLMHNQSHGGINKTTASIAEKYHWVRIKETVSAAIRNCSDCKEPAPKERRVPKSSNNNNANDTTNTTNSNNGPSTRATRSTAHNNNMSPPPPPPAPHTVVAGGPDPSTTSTSPPSSSSLLAARNNSVAPMANMHYHHHPHYDMPVDPQIMQDIQHWHHDQATGQAMVLDHHHQQQQHPSGGEGMEDGDVGLDVDTRLREELEAAVDGARRMG